MAKIPEKYTAGYWKGEFFRRVRNWSIGIAIGLAIFLVAIYLCWQNEGTMPSTAPKIMFTIFRYVVQGVVLFCFYNCGCNCIDEGFKKGKALGGAEARRNIRDEENDEEFLAELK